MDLAVVRITGVSVIAGCPQGESWLYNGLFCCRFPVIYPTPGTCLATATRKIGETETNSSFPIFHTRHNYFLSRYYTLIAPKIVYHDWDHLFQSSSNPRCHQVIHPNGGHCCQIPAVPRTLASQIPWVSSPGWGAGEGWGSKLILLLDHNRH